MELTAKSQQAVTLMVDEKISDYLVVNVCAYWRTAVGGS